MYDEILKSALHQAVENIELPPDIWAKIQQKAERQRKSRTVIKNLVRLAASVILILGTSLGSITKMAASAEETWLFKTRLGSFTLTIVHNLGERVAEITPTLFLPTTLSHAREVARLDIKVPAYLPEGIDIGPYTPTIVGRIGSVETVAIKVSERVQYGDGEIVHLDVRQTTAEELESTYPSDFKFTSEKVLINGHEGVLIMRENGRPRLFWTDGQYFFRMFGPEKKEVLIKMAESMK
ncbi:MAG: hypothetical protein CVU89_01840 [Firmicutes bacterium HGW-Firmicutes-14]|nr:MAG: hypothetical protein CVU89_01840 [Firmicutes bacterium HGW-Firmicutes-14]